MVRMIDMFPEAVRKKLDFFNKDKYTIATEEVDLKEKKKYGEVCLKCKLNKIVPYSYKLIIPIFR